MNPAIGADEPTPEFRAHLEWQIQTAMRREMRFSEPMSQRILPRLRVAVAVIVALAIGGAGGLASGYAQDNRERNQLLEAARTEESVLNLRLDVVRAEVDLARKRVETGVAGRETLIAAQDQLRALEAMQQRYRLDMEEIQVTSAAPRNDLQAPLVAKRDFVRERLMLDIATAERALAAAEQQADRAKQRYEVGIATATERQQADTDLAGARARLQVLAATLDLRARVLKGEIKGDDIASAKRQLELESQLRLLQLQLELTQARLTEARRRAAVGTASDVDIKRQELQVLEQQLEMKRVQQQLQALAMKK